VRTRRCQLATRRRHDEHRAPRAASITTRTMAPTPPHKRARGSNMTSTSPGPMRPMAACRTYCTATPRAPYRAPQEPRPPSGQSHICPTGAPAGHDEQQNTAAVPEAHVPWKQSYPGVQSHAEWHTAPRGFSPVSPATVSGTARGVPFGLSQPTDTHMKTMRTAALRRNMTTTTYRSGLVSRCRRRPSSRYTFSRASLPSSNS
jgi:hypothetical protein